MSEVLQQDDLIDYNDLIGKMSIKEKIKKIKEIMSIEPFRVCYDLNISCGESICQSGCFYENKIQDWYDHKLKEIITN